MESKGASLGEDEYTPGQLEPGSFTPAAFYLNCKLHLCRFWLDHVKQSIISILALNWVTLLPPS